MRLCSCEFDITWLTSCAPEDTSLMKTVLLRVSKATDSLLELYFCHVYRNLMALSKRYKTDMLFMGLSFLHKS